MKISICIPTYNRKDYLKETLASIYGQTFTDYEIVIVDDGSTDGTGEMLKQEGHTVRYFRQDNAGESAARNKLIELSQGELITFIDSDDLLFPYALEELLKAVERHGSDTIAYSSYTGIDEDGNDVPRRQCPMPSGDITTELFEHIHVHSCGTLCSKKVLQEAGDFDVSLPVCSPYVIWLKLSLNHKFAAIEKPTFKRRRHSGNLSEKSFKNSLIELNVLEEFYYNGGGKAKIPYLRAMRRLAKEGYRAGRCALREGKYKDACALLGQSLKRHFDVKTLFWGSVAKVRYWL